MTKRSNDRSRRRRAGLTLLECLIASVLLALGASAVMVAMSAGLQHQRYAREQRIATELAEQLLEQISARTYVHPDSPAYSDMEPTSAQAMDEYSDSVDATGATASGSDAYVRAMVIGSAWDAGVSTMTGVGVATVDVSTPSGRTVRLRRILPAKYVE